MVRALTNLSFQHNGERGDQLRGTLGGPPGVSTEAGAAGVKGRCTA